MNSFNQDLEKAYGKESFLDYLDKIKKGDVLLKDEFIRANKHFILNVISRILDKSAINENCTEYNVGLSAFNYSIDSFDSTVKSDFYTYSEQIIKEWVLDVINVEISKQSASDVSSREYLYRKFEDKDEISLFKNRLWEFGITLRDLYFLAPQDIDSIRSALKIANIIAANEILFNKLISNKNFPTEDLYDNSVFQKKFIDRNKEYIISLCLILKSNLKVLQSYLKNIASDKEFSDNVGVILEQYKKEAIILCFHGQFDVIKIKSSSKNIGKQIFLNSSQSSSLADNRFFKYAMAAGSMIAAVTIITLFSRYFIFNNTEETFSNNKQNYHAINNSTAAKASDKPAITADIKPSPTNNKIYSKPTSIVEPQIAVPAVNDGPSSISPSNTSKPKVNPNESAGKKAVNPSLIPVSSAITTNHPTARKNIAANGVPGAISITASSDKVNITDYIILTMNMSGGNNGTSLNLYKDGQFVKTFTLKDTTPAPQTRTVAIPTEAKGKYSYSFKLVNGFGASSSNTVTITVE